MRYLILLAFFIASPVFALDASPISNDVYVITPNYSDSVVKAVPSEIVSLRTADSVTLDLGNSSFEKRIYSSPQFYKDGSLWKAVDYSLEISQPLLNFLHLPVAYGATSTVYALDDGVLQYDDYDGYVYQYDSIVGYNDTSGTCTGSIDGAEITYNGRYFAQFDTSGIPDTATILSASFFIKPITSNNSPDPELYDASANFPLSSDADNNYTYIASLEDGSYSITGAFYKYDVSTLSTVNKTGYTQYAVIQNPETCIVGGLSQNITFYDSLASGTSNDPYLQVVYTDEEEEPILGCTDPEATNYNPSATEDDGSCEYESSGDTSTSTPIMLVGGLHTEGIIFYILVSLVSMMIYFVILVFRTRMFTR